MRWLRRYFEILCLYYIAGHITESKCKNIKKILFIVRSFSDLPLQKWFHIIFHCIFYEYKCSTCDPLTCSGAYMFAAAHSTAFWFGLVRLYFYFSSFITTHFYGLHLMNGVNPFAFARLEDVCIAIRNGNCAKRTNHIYASISTAISISSSTASWMLQFQSNGFSLAATHFVM